MNYSKFLGIFITILIVARQTASKNTEGVCNCDLAKDYCDLLCCCDRDCKQEDKNAFVCKNETMPKKYCVDELNNELITSNTIYIFTNISDLICIETKSNIFISNSNGLNSLNEQDLKKKTDLINPPNVASNLEMPNLSKSYFTTSDRIWVVNPGNIISYFKIPVQIGSSCRPILPVNYLTDKRTLCKSSSNESFFKVYPEYLNLRFIPSIGIWNNCVNSSNFYGCIGSQYNYTIQNCTNNSKLCENSNDAIELVIFTFEYLNPDGIIAATIFSDYQENRIISKRIFEIRFISKASSSNIIKKSGNPGYLIGEPVIAGTLDNITIIVNPDRNIRFTALTLDKDKFCDRSKRTPIIFGKNFVSECFISSKVNCSSSFNEEIENFILGPNSQMTHVAVFGSLIENISFSDDQWIKIINSKPKEPLLSKGVCSNLANELRIGIYFALVGNTNNPQAKILDIRYDWQTKNIKFPTDLPNDAWLIKTRITFLNFTLNSEYTQSKLKRTNLALSEDFFKPF